MKVVPSIWDIFYKQQYYIHSRTSTAHVFNLDYSIRSSKQRTTTKIGNVSIATLFVTSDASNKELGLNRQLVFDYTTKVRILFGLTNIQAKTFIISLSPIVHNTSYRLYP
jgi:hypothetical protein